MICFVNEYAIKYKYKQVQQEEIVGETKTDPAD